MTTLPDDPIDAREARFARRVRDYTEPAVVPVDHAAVASAAAGAGGPRRSSTAGRFGWLLAGAAAVAGVAAVAVLLGSLRGPETGASPSAPASNALAACSSGDLQGRILTWEGAAGSRIANVTLTSTATATCRLEDYQLVLADGGGRGLALITSTDLQPGITLEPGQQVATLIAVNNYCKAATPREPVSIRLQGTNDAVVFEPAGDGSSGVPPCNGPSVPSSISQQPWDGNPQG